MKILKMCLLVIVATLCLSITTAGWASQETKIHPTIRIQKDKAKNITDNNIPGYNPYQIKKAYGINNLPYTGAKQTIAIIEAFGSPTIENDLKVFEKEFKLPPARLEIVYPQGPPSEINPLWAGETSLDVEWAHALAPKAKIMLVVAKSDSAEDLIEAVDYAVYKGAQVVSMSWGGEEFPEETSLEDHFKHRGTVFIAASGDSGSTILWPALSPNVISVGGTTLPLDSRGNLTGPETAWTWSGGGISVYEPLPDYQDKYGISADGRGVPDVSFNADPETGVAVYLSTPIQGSVGWFEVGGTSFGAPAWAAIIALADQKLSRPLTDGHDALYQLGSGVNYSKNYRDITSGGNDSYSAGPGYDFVTGLGSPKVNKLINKLRSHKNVGVYDIDDVDDDVDK